ncbi:D-alanyl-D-alanine carboxypeptidase [Tenacibaculum sp. 190524A02b]|uniref:D-alanyl-D-alanine carboxypeptidase n=1 Tax=Tenacibaculum vairaonense TaxID=3137860 RepID=A0ABP1FDD4_9FLAO
MSKNLFLTVFLFIITTVLFGQISNQQLYKIDSLFNQWNAKNHPGGSIAISQNNKLIFSKAYGLASIEYNQPNTTQTIFNAGSIAKQFTAMAIVLLQEQNKLSVKDNIKKYIPELSNFPHNITIEQLLHHTSGLRDIHGFLALAGWRNDIITNKDLNNLLPKLRDLNFPPNTEFSYSNTGYMLLVNIIENVTNEPFENWMQQQIFKRFNMKHSYVSKSLDSIIFNKATSYKGGSTIKKALPYWGYLGSGNLYTTAEDLVVWLQNFSRSKNTFQKLLTTSLLEPLYAYGLSVETHLNKKIIQHGGAIGGFRSIIRSYPNDYLQIVILSNFTKGDILNKINQIGEIVFNKKEKETLQKTALTKTTNNVNVPNNFLLSYEDVYWNDIEKYGRVINLDNNTLQYVRTNSQKSNLTPINRNTFKMQDVVADVIVSFKEDKMFVKVNDEPAQVFQKHLSSRIKNINPKIYAGTYYSFEIETNFQISVEKQMLYLYHKKHGKIKLNKLYNDIYEAHWPFSCIEFKRNKNQLIKGLKISNGRVRNMSFKKIN